ncbi:uncharacterized protein EDB93DRAFT_303038 [Suillus bovinus]|uniref:uncharacterized protein n=1 Tax=Suillus bovinus TaxID=48563 RepID=UPI001B8647B3|nr:uncharacterized protein EDB93DRAFT_303038 [Suillus bovinus]KAG2151201.1 hypothetical protein EDB93DRAFT_303038 [Suillus bovinus]
MRPPGCPLRVFIRGFVSCYALVTWDLSYGTCLRGGDRVVFGRHWWLLLRASLALASSDRHKCTDLHGLDDQARVRSLKLTNRDHGHTYDDDRTITLGHIKYLVTHGLVRLLLVAWARPVRRQRPSGPCRTSMSSSSTCMSIVPCLVHLRQ